MQIKDMRNYTPRCEIKDPRNITELVDSLFRDGSDAQYMQYLKQKPYNFTTNTQLHQTVATKDEAQIERHLMRTHRQKE